MTFVPKLASSFNACDNSFSVSNDSLAPLIKFVTAVSIYSVVARQALLGIMEPVKNAVFSIVKLLHSTVPKSMIPLVCEVELTVILVASICGT